MDVQKSLLKNNAYYGKYWRKTNWFTWSIFILQGFPYWGGVGGVGGGGSTPPAKNSLIPTGKVPPVYSTPNKFLFPPHEKSIPPNYTKIFKSYNLIKTSFLAVVIAPLPFLFNFIIFWQTGHANFNFNWCSIFTECCF